MSAADIDGFILANMPHFIAVNYQRLLDARTPQDRVALALHTYNLGLRALTIGLVNQYLVQDRDSVSDRYLDDLLLKKFPHLTPDAWQELLFATLRAYEGNQDLLFIPELYVFYWDTSRVPHQPRPDIQRPFDRLTQLSVEQRGELLNRNVTDWEALADETSAILQRMLHGMTFMARYDLIRVQSYDDRHYEFELHKGVAITTGRLPLPTHTRLLRDSFYLRNAAGELLSLYPLLVFWPEAFESDQIVPADTGVYEHFIYERLAYLLATLRTTVVDDANVFAFVKMLYDTIEEVKYQRREAEKLSWWQLRDICAEITEKRMASVSDKYREDLYLKRNQLYQSFETFLGSEKRCFVLIGKSGVGKSNFCLALNQQFKQSRSDICILMYDGAKIEVALSINELVGQDFTRRLKFKNRPMELVWLEINRIEGIEQRLVIVWVDAINENAQAGELLRQLDDLAQGPWPWLKIVFSSRPETWRTIKRGVKLSEALYYREHGADTIGVELEPFSYSEQLESFSRQELPAAYARYQEVFKLQTPYDDLPGSLREVLRDPLSLYLVAHTYREQAIPPSLKLIELIERYIQALIKRDVLLDQDIYFLEQRLIPLMVQAGQYRNVITPGDLHAAGGGLYEAVYSDQVLSDGRRMNQSFTNLLDTEILVKQEQGREQRIEFKYERFYEYFMGRHILALSKGQDDRLAFFRNLIGQIAGTPFLWGAVKYALIQDVRDHGLETVTQLCFTEQQRVKEVMVSVLLDLGHDERAQVEKILKQLLPPAAKSGTIGQLRRLAGKSGADLELPVRTAGKIAVEVASDLGILWALETAALHTDPTLRAVAVRFTYHLWERDQMAGFEILGHIAKAMIRGVVPDFDALESFAGLSLIIFFNHPHDEPILMQLQQIWHGVIGKVLGIRETSGRFSKFLRTGTRELIFASITRLIFRLLQEFPKYLPDMSYEGVNSFFRLGTRERELYRNLTRYLDVGGDYSTAQMERDFLAASDLSSLLVEAVVVMGLIAHAYQDPEAFLPFLKRFFDKVHNQASPGQWPRYVPEVLDKMLESNPESGEIFDFFVKTMQWCQDYYKNHPEIPDHGPDAMYLGPYTYNYYRIHNTARSEWLEKHIREELASDNDHPSKSKNTAFFERLISLELPVVGIEIKQPHMALDALRLVFNTGKTDVDALVRAFLARLRIHYPDDVEDFLEEQRASEEFRLQVRTNEPAETVGSLIGLGFWHFVRDDMVIESPALRAYLIRVLEKAADCKDLRAWMDQLLREIINLVYGGEALRPAR